MNSLLSKAERQIKTINKDINLIEASLLPRSSPQLEVNSNDPNNFDIIKTSGSLNEVGAGLATAMITLKNLEESISRETFMDKRQIAKQKLKELKVDHQNLKERLERLKVQVKEKEKTLARTALLSSTNNGNSNVAFTNRHFSSSTLTQEALVEKEDRTLNYAEGRVGDFITLGASTLESLRNQRSILKSTQRRVLDAGTSLGLTGGIMKVISRRTAQDRYIFYTGVIVTLLVLYFCWKYLTMGWMT